MTSIIPADTSPDAWWRMIALYRRMTPAQKLAKVAALNASTREAALAGIRLRHPQATEREQRLYLFTLMHGDELAKKAFGWDPAVRGR